MQITPEASIIGLTIQWGGIAIVTVLSFLMAQWARRQFLEYWTLSWALRMLSLTSLLIAVSFSSPPRILYTVFFLADFGFAFLVLAGSRSHTCGIKVGLADRWVLTPVGLLAVLLPYLSDNFHTLMIPCCVVTAVFWIQACRTLHKREREPHEAGIKVMRTALMMLTINAVHYGLVYLYEAMSGRSIAAVYLEYSPLYDLLLEMLLAFGMVIFLMESRCRQLEGENLYLAANGHHFQALAEQDPLTGALNRHAFYAFHQRSQRVPVVSTAGCVAVVDVDDFKTINDTLGHTAGDRALRAVARSIRAVVRADDLLFRWGGDEFLVVLVGLGEAETRARLCGLNAALAETGLNDADLPTAIAVSCGVGTFTGVTDLDRSINIADREMYAHKQARKMTKYNSVA
jgi:diguanylate cyclase (GGDEF)-like protein